MTFRRQLARTELVALAALLGVAASLAAFVAIRTAAFPGDPLGPFGAAAAVGGYTLAIGFVPVALLGAPLYAWLRSMGRASWGAALCIGLAPGLVLLLVASDLGSWAMGCGTVVALVTHAVCGRGPDNPSEPASLHDATRSRSRHP